jgi:hypothetical protein
LMVSPDVENPRQVALAGVLIQIRHWLAPALDQNVCFTPMA